MTVCVKKHITFLFERIEKICDIIPCKLFVPVVVGTFILKQSLPLPATKILTNKFLILDWNNEILKNLFFLDKNLLKYKKRKPSVSVQILKIYKHC